MMRRTMIVAAAAVALGGCSAAEQVEQAATQVKAFHAAFDADRMGVIWANTGPMMRAQTSETDFVTMLARLKQRLGAVQATKQVGWNVNYGNQGAIVTLAHETRFARGAAREQFVFQVNGSQARLAGYHVNFPALLGN